MSYEELIKKEGLNYDYKKDDEKKKIIFKKLWKEYNDKCDELETKIEVIKWEIYEEEFKGNLLNSENNNILIKLKKKLYDLEKDRDEVLKSICIMQENILYKIIEEEKKEESHEYDDCGMSL